MSVFSRADTDLIKVLGDTEFTYIGRVAVDPLAIRVDPKTLELDPTHIAVLFCKSSDLPDDAAPGDTFRIGNVSYNVIDLRRDVMDGAHIVGDKS